MHLTGNAASGRVLLWALFIARVAAGLWWRSNIASRRKNAQAFHSIMRNLQLSLSATEVTGVRVARDIADPELWTARCHRPTWLDYLRQRNRWTWSDRALDRQMVDFTLIHIPCASVTC